MGFVRDTLEDVGITDVKSAVFGGNFDVADLGGVQGERDALLASQQAEASQLDALGRSIAETQRSTAEGQGFLSPFSGIGEQAIGQAGFLTDPQAQFDFLQNNPLFQASLDNANQQTLQSAAARGRLSSGDTLQQLSQNTLLSASPLIQQQKQSIGNLLNFGQGLATTQANTAIGQGSEISNAFQNQGNVLAAGIQGRNQIGQDANANRQQTAATIGGALLSDPKLKKDIVKTGTENGFNTYKWTWNKLANSIGVFGESFGVMADEVKKIMPKAIVMDGEFMRVNYEMVGVKHGY